MSERFKDLSFLVSSGRAGKGVPASREEILAALLRKRAAAWNAGLGSVESQLRSQITWSLPVIRTSDNEIPFDVANDAAKPGD